MSITRRTASRVGPGPDDCTLFGLAPNGVYKAGRVTSAAGALLPHRFTLTTHPEGPFGGVLSVALSLASRPVDVIDHPVLRSPDFPPDAEASGDRPTLSQLGSKMIDSGQSSKVRAGNLLPINAWRTLSVLTVAFGR